MKPQELRKSRWWWLSLLSFALLLSLVYIEMGYFYPQVKRYFDNSGAQLHSNWSPGLAPTSSKAWNTMNFADGLACRFLHQPFVDTQFLDPDFLPEFANARNPPSAAAVSGAKQLHTDSAIYFT